MEQVLTSVDFSHIPNSGFIIFLIFVFNSFNKRMQQLAENNLKIIHEFHDLKTEVSNTMNEIRNQHMIFLNNKGFIESPLLINLVLVVWLAYTFYNIFY